MAGLRQTAMQTIVTERRCSRLSPRILSGEALPTGRKGDTMKNASLSMIAVVAALVLIGATCAFAQDWPQWRGANRDGEVAGFTAPETWPKELTQKWKVTVGAGDATPALVGDKLYVFTRQGDDEVTLCLDADTGNELWRNTYAAQAVTGAAARHPGPRGSPAVGDGKVVTLGVGGVLSCLDAVNGKVVWRKDPFPKVVPKFFTSISAGKPMGRSLRMSWKAAKRSGGGPAKARSMLRLPC